MQTSKDLLTQYQPLVCQIAGAFLKRLPRNVLREDLIAAGQMGLWAAIQKHQTSENFEAYARIRIRGAILDELRAQDWLPRRARQAALKADAAPPAVVRFDDVSEWQQNEALKSHMSSETAASSKEQQEVLLQAVDTLPERERYIVAQHYMKGVKFKDLAQELKVSEPRISQLHSRAMQRLRERAELSA